MRGIKVSRRGVEYDEGIVREIVPTIDYGRVRIPQPINPPLEIRKGFGTLCQGERAEKYFCLKLVYNTLFERAEVYAAGTCEKLAPFSLPAITASPECFMCATTVNSDEYPLVPGIYLLVYNLFENGRPAKAVIKRFKVVDANDAEELDAWSCYGEECRNFEDAFRRMCKG
jgi:hypothetical protein